MVHSVRSVQGVFLNKVVGGLISVLESDLPPD